MKGKVTQSTGSWYQVLLEDGREVNARIKGKFRLDELKVTNPVAVGDEVEIDPEPEVGSLVIHQIHPRKNYILRRSPRKTENSHIIASNIDRAFLIVTVAKPRTSSGFIDRFLATCEAYDIPVSIIFNKQDVLKDKELKKQQHLVDIYTKLNYDSLLISALNGSHVDELIERMKGSVSLVAGHSGVGKSTLINAVQPDLDLRTDTISGHTNKGKHTTTYATMHSLDFGGFLIDTPGIKEFGMLGYEIEEVSHYFREMQALLNECKFHNCLHRNEPGCAVKEAVENGEIAEERYRNYLSILEEIESQKAW